VLLALLLAAAAGPPPPTLALPGLSGVRLDAGETELYGDLLSVELQQFGFKVLSSRDIGELIGPERQRDLLACGASDSCIAEIVGALGVDGIIVGDVGRLGEQYTVSVKVLSAKNAVPLALHTGRAGSAKAVPKELAMAARDLAHQLAGAWSRPELEPPLETPRRVQATAASAATGGSSNLPLIPVVIGGAAVIAGVVMEVVASAEYQTLINAPTADIANAAHDTGKSLETLGWIFFATGTAAALAGGATWLFGHFGRAPRPRIVFGPGSASLGLCGELP
jgi:hypothetical protein